MNCGGFSFSYSMCYRILVNSYIIHTNIKAFSSVTRQPYENVEMYRCVNDITLKQNYVKVLRSDCFIFAMMKRNTILKILLGIVALLLFIKFLMTVFVDPHVRKKIETTLNEKNSDYLVTIDKVHILMLSSGIKLSRIKIQPKKDFSGILDLYGEIASVKLAGIKFAKAIFKKDINIRKITISESLFMGKISFPREAVTPIVLPKNIRIGIVLFDKINLSVENTANAESYSFKDCVLKLYEVQVEKQDTLSSNIIKQFDFKGKELFSVSSDSMYLYKASDIIYYAKSNTLAVTNFYIQPNYTDYDFASNHEFLTSRIEARFSDIYFYNFYVSDYFRFGSLRSSWMEIGKMDMNVFRDKRKQFRHGEKPAFLDMVYNYPGIIQIDSIGLIKGNVIYTEHAEKANEPGSISFNEISGKMYKITNDTIYKTENDSLRLRGNALLMGKGKMTILLKGRLFESQNTFSLNGTLSALEANELNPILEKNAFIYATSGKIDSMNFSFTANNAKATGKMTLLYHGLDIAVKNKHSDDTTAFRERFISLIVNRKVSDSNPIPNDDVREGIIDYERDPEKEFLDYCFMSILSGIKSSFLRNP